MHQQAAGVRPWGQTRTGNRDRKEQLCSFMSPSQKSITSLLCLNWLRSAVKSFGNKLWESTVIATNPSSPSPCNAPKSQNLCGDHSGFLIISSERYNELSHQVNISCLLPEPLPPLDVMVTSSADRRQCNTLRAPKFITSVEKA